MIDNENKVPTPQPEPIPAPAPDPQPEPVPAPAPAPQPEPVSAAAEDSAPAWEKPVPQLTLEPDPAPPTIEFNSPPPRAPEPPRPETPAGQNIHEPTAHEQPPVQNQYVYNFNTVPSPDQGYQQNHQSRQDQNPGQYQYDPSGYQPPNYTAQSYQPQPPQPPKYTTPPVGYQQKSRLAAGLLAITLGCLGIHNFYMGYNTRGTIQLVLCLAGGLLTCGVGSIAALIWGFIEGVMLLSSNNVRFDGNGVIMKD